MTCTSDKDFEKMDETPIQNWPRVKIILKLNFRGKMRVVSEYYK